MTATKTRRDERSDLPILPVRWKLVHRSMDTNLFYEAPDLRLEVGKHGTATLVAGRDMRGGCIRFVPHRTISVAGFGGQRAAVRAVCDAAVAAGMVRRPTRRTR